MQRAAAIEPVKEPWALPEGWRWVPLGSLGDFWNGAAFKPSDWGEEGTPIIRIQNLNDPARVMNRTTRVVDDRLLIRAGDLLVSWSASLDAYVWNREDAWLNQHIFKVVPHVDIVHHRYILFLLKNEIENLKKTEHLHGSTMMHINRGPFLAHLVPLPPMNTQELVVECIDELFTEVDDGEAALEQARLDLVTWRKALLKAAVTGELTADWRAANPLTETGADLLARILAERRTRWLADPRNKGKRYIEPAGPYAANLPELPDGWTWASVEQLATSGPTNGYSPAKSIDGEGTLALKLTATTSGQMRLDSKSVKALGETIDAASPLFLEGGDLLFQRGNTREYVGMAAIYDGPSKTYIYPDLMIRVRTGSRSLTDWLWRWSVSPHGRKYLMDAAQGGAGTMPKISGQTIRSMPVPLPPIAEQERVLQLINGALSGEASLPPADLEDASLSATLRQSILAAAFRGDLVA